MKLGLVWGMLFLSLGLLLGGCAELQTKLDVALYGSVEEAQKSRDKYELGRQQEFEKNIKKFENTLYQMIGEERARHGLPPRLRQDVLFEVARVRAKEISELYSDVRPNGWAHYSVYRQYEELAHRSVSSLGELKAVTGRNAPEDALKFWLTRTEYKKVLLHKDAYAYAVSVWRHDSEFFWVFVAYSRS